MNTLQILSLSALLLTGCRDAPNAEAELQSMIVEVSEKFDDVPDINTADLAIWLADPKREQPLLLDVREADEYAVSHLPGAIQVSPEASPEQLIEQIDFTRPIVLYCSVGYRSSILAQRLTAAGAKQAINLEGSIFKWANEGRPMLHDSEATDKAHPYNRKFGRMLKDSLQAYD